MTFLLETLRLGLSNLMLHKLRSVLTSLGIILGVAAVIIMVSIGEGNKQAALREIQALGATNVIVRSKKPPESGTFTGQERAMVVKFGLTRQDHRRLEHAVTDHVVHLVPLKAVGAEISQGARRAISQTFGTTPELAKAANLRIARGRYLSAQDMTDRLPVAVIGSDIASDFFPLRDPVGEIIRIDDRVFRVIGVLEPIGLAAGKGSALVGRNLNQDVHIPLSTAEIEFGDMIFRRQAGSFTGEEIELYEVYITANATETVTQTAEMVRQIVRVGHPEMLDVEIHVPWELLESQKRIARVLNTVLISIAAISLLIGGIGIMNIMLASVTERTREIGIRRALGATRRHIVYQFLVETGTLSAVGGVLGIALGVFVSIAIEPTLPRILRLPFLRDFVEATFAMETQVTGWSIIASFLVAASVGLIFGIYPAVIASRQDPIVALRHD